MGRISGRIKCLIFTPDFARCVSFSDFFCMKLGYHKHSKVTKRYFSRKMSFAKKKGLKWTVSIISQNGLKVKVIFFSDILHEVKGT